MKSSLRGFTIGIGLLAILLTTPSKAIASDMSIVEYYDKESIIQDYLSKSSELIRATQIELAKMENTKMQGKIERKKSKMSIDKSNRGVSMSVPSGDTSFKSYLCHSKITNTSSPQYRLQKDDEFYIDSDGCARYQIESGTINPQIDYYVVALGTAYFDNIGDKLQIELSNGFTFNAIVGDAKANSHTDPTNRQHKKDGSVVEFLVNLSNNKKRNSNWHRPKLNKSAKLMGSISFLKSQYYDGEVFNGNISKIFRMRD